jgi:nucleoside-triphosphatase THEP1
MKIDFKNFFTMCIFGLPGSGKTTLMRYLIYNASIKNEFDHCLLFSSTKGTKDYDFLDEKYKFDAMNNEVIEKYINLCQKKNEKSIKTRGLIIFDDICGEQTFKSALFKKLFSNYRHYGISIIVCQQMPVELPLSIRSIIKYACVYKYINKSDREKVYNCFGSMCENEKTFYELYDKYTQEKYMFMFFSQSDVYDTSACYIGARAPNKRIKFKLQF